MKAVYTILINDSGVTDLVEADSIVQLIVPQAARPPFIVITDDDLTDPHDTHDGQILDERNITVQIFSNYLYNNGTDTGADEIAEAVRTALHSVSGVYSGQDVKVNFQDDSRSIFQGTAENLYLIEQEYQVFVKR